MYKITITDKPNFCRLLSDGINTTSQGNSVEYTQEELARRAGIKYRLIDSWRFSPPSNFKSDIHFYKLVWEIVRCGFVNANWVIELFKCTDLDIPSGAGRDWFKSFFEKAGIGDNEEISQVVEKLFSGKSIDEVEPSTSSAPIPSLEASGITYSETEKIVGPEGDQYGHKEKSAIEPISPSFPLEKSFTPPRNLPFIQSPLLRRFSALLVVLVLGGFLWAIFNAKPPTASEAESTPTNLAPVSATPTPLTTNVAASSTTTDAENSTKDCFDRVTSFAANAENSTATLSPPYNDRLYTGPAMLVYTTSNSAIEIRGLSQLNLTNSIDVSGLEPIIGLYAIENPDARDTFRLLATTQKGIIYSWIVGIDDNVNISYSGERNLEGHTGRVNSLVGIEGGARMISAADDGYVILWNFEVGGPESIWRLDKPDSAAMTAIHSIAYHLNGLVAFGNGIDGSDGFGYDAVMPIDFPAICYAADSHNLCTIAGMSVSNESEIKPVHQSRISSVAFSKDGRFLFSVGVNDPEIKIWKLNKLDALNFAIDYVTSIPIPQLPSAFEIFNVTVGGNDDYLLVGIHSLSSSPSPDTLRRSYFSVFEFNSSEPQKSLYIGDLIGKTANSQILFTMLIPDTTNLVTASADELLSLYNYNIEDGERQEPVDYIDLKDELKNDNVTILYVSRTVIRDGIPDTDVSENSEVIAVLTSIHTDKNLMIYGINDACLSH